MIQHTSCGKQGTAASGCLAPLPSPCCSCCAPAFGSEHSAAPRPATLALVDSAQELAILAQRNGKAQQRLILINYLQISTRARESVAAISSFCQVLFAKAPLLGRNRFER